MIQQETLNFLKDLALNNNREWFNANKDRYQEARENFKFFIGSVLAQLVEIEPGVQGLQPKDCMFRIYRDVRFSKNKAPYKTNFGASMGMRGRKSPFPSYYIHIQPDSSFIGGGVYHPSGEVLKAIRQEVDYNFEQFRDIVEDAKFKKNFGTLRGEKLKTKPKGYDTDNPAIDFLRHKDFIAMHAVADEKLMQKDFDAYVVEKFKVMKDFNEFLKMPIFDVVD